MSSDGSHISTGVKGEDLACVYLVEKGYRIEERNARRKWGEIDIVCSVLPASRQGGRGTYGPGHKTIVPRGTLSLHNTHIVPRGTISRGKIVFIEVKTMRPGSLRPEENMTKAKQRKLIRTCQLYLTEHGLSLDCDWQIDVLAVVLNSLNELTEIRHIEQAVY